MFDNLNFQALEIPRVGIHAFRVYLEFVYIVF